LRKFFEKLDFCFGLHHCSSHYRKIIVYERHSHLPDTLYV